MNKFIWLFIIYSLSVLSSIIICIFIIIKHKKHKRVPPSKPPGPVPPPPVPPPPGPVPPTPPTPSNTANTNVNPTPPPVPPTPPPGPPGPPLAPANLLDCKTYLSKDQYNKKFNGVVSNKIAQLVQWFKNTSDCNTTKTTNTTNLTKRQNIRNCLRQKYNTPDSIPKGYSQEEFDTAKTIYSWHGPVTGRDLLCHPGKKIVRISNTKSAKKRYQCIYRYT